MPNLIEKINYFYEDEEIYNRFPQVVDLYFQNALGSYITTNYYASLAASSASVEVSINHDLRILKHRGEMQNWLNLNLDLLRIAKNEGLPIDEIMIKDDDLEKENVSFIIRRNKFWPP